jgi:hypothetical protein
VAARVIGGTERRGFVRSLLFLDRKRFARSYRWHSHVIRSKQYVLLKKTIRLLSVKPREAAGSTSEGASPSMPNRSSALAKPVDEAAPFGSIEWLISVESLKKPKQTPP